MSASCSDGAVVGRRVGCGVVCAGEGAAWSAIGITGVGCVVISGIGRNAGVGTAVAVTVGISVVTGRTVAVGVVAAVRPGTAVVVGTTVAVTAGTVVAAGKAMVVGTTVGKIVTLGITVAVTVGVAVAATVGTGVGGGRGANSSSFMIKSICSGGSGRVSPLTARENFTFCPAGISMVCCVGVKV